MAALAGLALQPDGLGQWLGGPGRKPDVRLQLLEDTALEAMATDSHPAMHGAAEGQVAGGASGSLGKRYAPRAATHCTVLEEEGEEEQDGGRGEAGVCSSPQKSLRSTSRGSIGERGLLLVRIRG